MLQQALPQLGNRYYKQNNIKKAQEFYEKSFALGNKDTGVREIYVNSIINSPLDIDAQEKLVRLAEDNIQDAASIKAKYFLYDLKREIHDRKVICGNCKCVFNELFKPCHRSSNEFIQMLNHSCFKFLLFVDIFYNIKL